ncbi:MAG: hypothetical protein R2752_07830 [Vicinamibacterales bacterium]
MIDTLVVWPIASSLREPFVSELEQLGHEVIITYASRTSLEGLDAKSLDSVVFESGRLPLASVRAQIATRQPVPFLVELVVASSDRSASLDQRRIRQFVSGREHFLATVSNADWQAAARDVNRLTCWGMRRRNVAAQFVALHGRLLRAERDERVQISEEISALVRPELLTCLGRWCGPCADRDDLLSAAVADALVKYLARPFLCDPAAGDPVAWFTAIAKNKVIDALRDRKRRAEWESPAGVDWDLDRMAPPTAPNPPGEGDGLATHTRELVERLLPFAWTRCEERYLWSKFGGGSIAEQAEALGITGSSLAELRAVTRTAWHRIKERGVRAGAIGPRRRRPGLKT